LKTKGLNATIQKSSGGVIGGSLQFSRRVIIELESTK
jgi:hypothetical protein